MKLRIRSKTNRVLSIPVFDRPLNPKGARIIEEKDYSKKDLEKLKSYQKVGLISISPARKAEVEEKEKPNKGVKYVEKVKKEEEKEEEKVEEKVEEDPEEEALDAKEVENVYVELKDKLEKPEDGDLKKGLVDQLSMDLTAAELRKIADALDVELEANDTKAVVIEKIEKAFK